MTFTTPCQAAFIGHGEPMTIERNRDAGPSSTLPDPDVVPPR